MDIRPITQLDIENLNQFLPSDIPTFHQRKLMEQQAGKSVWLIVWEGEEPVGHGEIVWAGSNRTGVRRYVTDTPQLNSLFTREEFRGWGYGTELIKALEGCARDKGYKQVGLSVEVNNDGAIRLYERLGFCKWTHGTFDGSWIYTDSNSNEHEVREKNVYMLKDL